MTIQQYLLQQPSREGFPTTRKAAISQQGALICQ
jgi:hypothetical protein